MTDLPEILAIAAVAALALTWTQMPDRCATAPVVECVRAR